MLVVIAGSELLTGNMALVPLAAACTARSRSRTCSATYRVLVGNLLGALFVAYFLAVQTGVLTADAAVRAARGDRSSSKGIDETEWQIFLRALGCNWLVCLAVWMALAADDVTGKILAIFFPIMAFVAMGFDHVDRQHVLPARGDLRGRRRPHLVGRAHNWIFAFLGNLVGAAVFVAGSYYYLYGRDEEAAKFAATLPRQGRCIERDRAPSGRRCRRG